MLNRIVVTKNYLLKHAIHAISVFLLSLTPLICFILMLMNITQNADVTERVAQAEKAVVTQENIIKSFMEYSRRADNEDIMVAVDMVNKDHTHSIAAMKESIVLLKNIALREQEMMVVVAIIMVAHIGLLFVYFINKKDKNIGSIFPIPRYSTYLMNSKKTSARRMWVRR
jgi:hypothetical protein